MHEEKLCKGSALCAGIFERLPSCCAEFYTKFRTVFSSRGENVSGCFIISAINGSNTNQRQYGSRGIKNRPIRSKAKRGAIDNWELVKRFHFGCGQAGH